MKHEALKLQLKLGVHLKGKIASGLLLMIFMTMASADNLFGYQESARKNLTLFPQWLAMLERNIKQTALLEDCHPSLLNPCHARHWLDYLQGISQLSKIEQINKVNLYANEHDYILDIDNYGMSDYWATPGEFLNNNGDCEDYAIIKMLSLKILGFDMTKVRLVVLQDTNLRVPHAILVVSMNQDILVMDNQVNEVISHHNIVHYAPVYAVDEKKWWIFYPQ